MSRVTASYALSLAQHIARENKLPSPDGDDEVSLRYLLRLAYIRAREAQYEADSKASRLKEMADMYAKALDAVGIKVIS